MIIKNGAKTTIRITAVIIIIQTYKTSRKDNNKTQKVKTTKLLQ